MHVIGKTCYSNAETRYGRGCGNASTGKGRTR